MITRRFLFAVALGSAVCTLGACRNHAGTNDDAFRWTEPIPPGSVVHLLNGSGNVTVRSAGSNAAFVQGSTRWMHGRASDVQFVVNHTGRDYYVCAMWRASGRCDAHGYRGARSNSFLTMFSLFHRRSDAQAAFDAEIPAGVAVDVQATNGMVAIEGVSSGVEARTVNGGVRATGVSGPLALKTMNGDVHVSADTLSAWDSIRIETMNGGIFADLPASLQGSFDLRATNGSVHTDFALGDAASGRRNHVSGQIGASNRLVRMHTMNGNVSVTARGYPSSH